MNFVSRDDLGVQRGGRIVARIGARERIAYALAETKIFICAPHGIVHGVRQKFALDVHVLPDLGEDHRIAGILADGHGFGRGGAGVLQYGVQGKFRRARLFFFRLGTLQRLRTGGGEAEARFSGELVYGFFDFVCMNGSHGNSFRCRCGNSAVRGKYGRGALVGATGNDKYFQSIL